MEVLSAEARSLPAAWVAQGLAVPFRWKPQKEVEVGVITGSVWGALNLRSGRVGQGGT